MDGVTGDEEEHGLRVRRLEQANEELRAANLRLARGRLGSSEAAAAGAQARVQALRDEIAGLREALRERDRRIEELTEVAARNDELYRMQLAWNDAARYRTADRAVELLGRFAVLRALVRAGRWLDQHVGR
jgi:predicted RNase H-like nuclease (RuvC/YqgF family)